MGKFAGWAALTLFVVAAHMDASPEQREQLRLEVLPLVKEIGDRSTSPARVEQLVPMALNSVIRIMGSEWALPEKDKAQIEKLV